MMNNNGMTLIELVIVVTVIGILAAALAFSFQGWIGSYNVESQIKEMHIDLMNARAMAMKKNKMHFVDLTTTQYSIYEDTDPAPDGDGDADPGNDDPVSQKNLDARYPIAWSDAADTRIEFNIRGLSRDDKTVCSNTTVDADYDCISISATRINMGELTTPLTEGGACSAANCVAK
ncbi:MAG: type II secretion system protein [Nitrospiraceae bacterium]|nr:MAG: type II secretion system protein [Nitrospiraceae bacterium]